MPKTPKTKALKAGDADAAVAKAIALADAQTMLDSLVSETREKFNALIDDINAKIPADKLDEYLEAYEKLSPALRVMFACKFDIGNVKKVLKALSDKDASNVKFFNSSKIMIKDEEEEVDWIIRVLECIVTKNDVCTKALADMMRERIIGPHIIPHKSIEPTTPECHYARALVRTVSRSPRSPHRKVSGTPPESPP
jgi:hypothetical protein